MVLHAPAKAAEEEMYLLLVSAIEQLFPLLTPERCDFMQHVYAISCSMFTHE